MLHSTMAIWNIRNLLLPSSNFQLIRQPDPRKYFKCMVIGDVNWLFSAVHSSSFTT